MEAEDWKDLDELFHIALELSPKERVDFLERECAGRELLRAEIVSLIDAFEQDADFLEKNAFEGGLKAISEQTSRRLEEQTIGHYKVTKWLGEGGMGEVYLAEDTTLKRLVALKFLARHLAADNWAKRQLIKEAQAAARLDHPNICAVYGFEEADGHSFIVMHFVEGEALSSVIKQKLFSVQEALPLALQLVSALAHAHEHGILHRDIKPQNIILTTDKQVKVLDFGLAKVIQEKQGGNADEALSQMSLEGAVMGTVAYMSPEQLRAERLDFRSDIFSLGLVLYAMLEGKNPFLKKSNAETISAILTNKPKSLPHQFNGASSEFDRVIRKCLEKEKERRYESANELMLDLQNLQKNPPRIPRPRVKWLAVAALFLIAMLSAWKAYSYFLSPTPPMLVIFPFKNELSTSEDKNQSSTYTPLIAGLPENLVALMAQLPKIRVIAPAIGNTEKPPNEMVANAKQKLDASVAMFGRAFGTDESAMLQIQLVKVSDGSQLWERSYDLRHTNALELLKLLSTEVAEKLSLQLSEKEGNQLQTAQSSDPEAFKHYLRGRYLYKNRKNQKDIQAAIKSFEAAISLDPAMARAHAGLADCYLQMPSVAYRGMPMEEAVKYATAAANEALRANSQLPEAYTSLGLVNMKYHRDYAEAEVKFRQAIQYDPNYADARLWYSQLLVITGRAGEALIESKRARDIDPLSPSLNLNQCRTWFMSRQYDTAVQCLSSLLEERPDYVSAKYVLGHVYQEKGRQAEAIELFQNIYLSDPELGSTPLGYALGKAGRRNEAVKILQEMEKRAKIKHVPDQEFAIVYLGLGDKEKAFQYLEMAYNERFGSIIYLTVEPLFDSLRGDARFNDLARRLKLNP